MLRIPLTQGKFALLDNEDADLISLPWCVYHQGSEPNIRWYVGYHGPIRNKSLIRMHRVIMERKLGRPLKKGEYVDHCNQDPLDNTRSNVRLTTHQKNQSNARRWGVSKTSQFKGVCLQKYPLKWRAYITVDYRQKALGRFNNEMDAAKAYDKAAITYFGEHACLNFPEET